MNSENIIKIKRAVIFTRDENPRKLSVCYAYARNQGLNVIRTFSGSSIRSGEKQDGYAELLDYLSKQRAEKIPVIVFDLGDLPSEDYVLHSDKRDEIFEAGGELVCPSYEFKNGATDRFMENMGANLTNYERNKLSEQDHDGYQ